MKFTEFLTEDTKTFKQIVDAKRSALRDELVKMYEDSFNSVKGLEDLKMIQDQGSKDGRIGVGVVYDFSYQGLQGTAIIANTGASITLYLSDDRKNPYHSQEDGKMCKSPADIEKNLKIRLKQLTNAGPRIEVYQNGNKNMWQSYSTISKVKAAIDNTNSGKFEYIDKSKSPNRIPVTDLYK